MKNKTEGHFIILHFTGIDLEPDMITQCLDVPPNKCAYAGDIIEMPSGVKKEAKKGYWNYLSKLDLPTSDHMSFFTKKFIEKQHAIEEIVKMDSTENAYIEFVVTPSKDFGVFSTLLNSEIMKFWSSIGIDIVISVWNPLI